MKKIGITLSVIAAALVLTFATTSVSATYIPLRGIELAADVLDTTVDALKLERETTGKSVHQIIIDAGLLEALHTARLAQIKLILDDRVANGILTQAEADQIYAEQLLKFETAKANGTLGEGLGALNGRGRGIYRGVGKGNAKLKVK
jgi:hypothetical protein